MDNADIYLNKEDNNVYITGTITFDNVTKIVKQGIRIIDTIQEVVVDLTEIRAADSSVLVLFTSLIKAAKKQHKDIGFINFPDCLQDLMHVSGLDDIILKK